MPPSGPHGMISNDGPKNIIDSVDYIASHVWADEQGRNQAGAVLIQEQRVFAARAVQKADARPGGYVATGGHGVGFSAKREEEQNYWARVGIIGESACWLKTSRWSGKSRQPP